MYKVTSPELVVVASPPAGVWVASNPFTVPELIVIPFRPAAGVFVKLPLVPVLVQVVVLLLVLHTNCAHEVDDDKETRASASKQPIRPDRKPMAAQSTGRDIRCPVTWPNTEYYRCSPEIAVTLRPQFTEFDWESP